MGSLFVFSQLASPPLDDYHLILTFKKLLAPFSSLSDCWLSEGIREAINAPWKLVEEGETRYGIAEVEEGGCGVFGEDSRQVGRWKEGGCGIRGVLFIYLWAEMEWAKRLGMGLGVE